MVDEIDDDPPLPEALAEAFAAAPEAHARWRALRRGDRWFNIGPIIEAKKPETKARRAQAIVDWLLHEIDDTTVPPELEAVLAADPEVRRLFDALPKRDRIDWCQRVRAAKKPETRVRRAELFPDRLRAKVAEKERRNAEGTDDLGGRFGQLVIDVVGADLRAAGYRPRQKGKHWRRVRGDRADLIGFHTFTRTSHEFAELRLEGGVYLPALDRAMGMPASDPARARTEDGLPVPDDLTDDDRHFAITAEVDEGALMAKIRRVLLARMAAIDDLGDLSTGPPLVDFCTGLGSLGHRTAALVIAGRREEARALLLSWADEFAAAGSDPRIVRWATGLAEASGLGLDGLPNPQVVEPVDLRTPALPVVDEIRRALGPTASWAAAQTDGSIDLQLVLPTDEQVEEARAIAGDHTIRIQVVRISAEEQTRVLHELNDALLTRERERDDLVAHVGSWGVGRIVVNVANLDAETEAIIRDIVPDEVLTISTHRSEAVLLVEKRHRLAHAAASS